MSTQVKPSKLRIKSRAQRGFTLIEIMVVVIIIGLLAAVVVPQFLGRVDDARIAKTKQDIQALDTALTMYKLDNFVYPTAEMGLQALVVKPNDPTAVSYTHLDVYKRQAHIHPTVHVQGLTGDVSGGTRG